MYGARLDTKFIALVFGIYDASDRRLTLANAGEPYPLLIRGGKATLIEVSGVPLGLFGETQYDEITVDLLPGDVVVCASDGISDAEDPHEESFGTERLYTLLAEVTARDSAVAIADRILGATDEFSGVNAAADDRTLVVLRVTDEIASDFSKLPIIY